MTVGRPISVKGVVTAAPRTTAVPESSVASVVTHGLLPARTGSTASPFSGSPPAELIVCASARPKRTAPGWIAGQLSAVNGPPAGASRGQVCVNVVTLPGAGPRAV